MSTTSDRYRVVATAAAPAGSDVSFVTSSRHMAAIAAREHEVRIRAAEATVARAAEAAEAAAVALCVEEEDVDNGAWSNALRSPHRCCHAEWHRGRRGRHASPVVH